MRVQAGHLAPYPNKKYARMDFQKVLGQTSGSDNGFYFCLLGIMVNDTRGTCCALVHLPSDTLHILFS